MFYIVQTKDEFIKSITRSLYKDKNHRILRVISFSDDAKFIRVAGSQDTRIYETTVYGFAEMANILERITINPN